MGAYTGRAWDGLALTPVPRLLASAEHEEDLESSQGERGGEGG